ncbi:hypothetical protein GCM10009122_54780 [Fulvivirga kasyanovii]|uniref:Bulb-type lectin domain-containing protein n=1 Tax=Fulvivirga kasyanovii TaxID=396812 RepID=A0ABW9RX06_9BACT|nr:hypothetical protein [Fulvivirga kasyanovii]MTI28498.1 hypothetical protein [Fulvivirga kasyanovii]
MNRFYNILIIGLLAVSCANEEDVTAGKPETFVKYYGGINSDISSDMKETSDGSYILLGTTVSEAASDEEVSKIRLIKTDVDGNVIWDRAYPDNQSGESTNNLMGRAVIEISNGYLVVGDSIYEEDNQELTNMFLLTVDQNGNTIAGKSISFDNASLHGYAVTLTDQGNYFVLATIEGNTAPENMYLAEVSSADLNVVWSQTYGIGDDANISKTIITDENNNVTWSGTTTRNGENDIRIITTPANSKNTFFDETIGLNNGKNELGFDIRRTPFGYAIIGSTNNTAAGDQDILLTRVNTNGKLLGSVTFGGSKNDTGEAITVTEDGSLLILGSTDSFGRGERDFYLIKTDMFGNPVWTENEGVDGKIFGSVNMDTGSTLLETSTGHILVLGTTEFGDVDTMVLIKTDDQGNI